jgi:hypothetical protein
MMRHSTAVSEASHPNQEQAIKTTFSLPARIASYNAKGVTGAACQTAAAAV